jgi:hypothetical protein
MNNVGFGVTLRPGRTKLFEDFSLFFTVACCGQVGLKKADPAYYASFFAPWTLDLLLQGIMALNNGFFPDSKAFTHVSGCADRHCDSPSDLTPPPS